MESDLRNAVIRDRLANLDQGGMPLGEAALALAALIRPGTSLAPYEAHLRDLAEEVAALAGEGAFVEVEDLAACLAEVLARRHRYHDQGGDGDDSRNAVEADTLMGVIDRGRGRPVALGVLYLDVARGAGWIAEGLSFPVHFLVRLCDAEGRRVIIDPAAGGRLVDVADLRALWKAAAGMDAELDPSLYAPLDDREILLRLLNDAKTRVLRAGGLRRALSLVEAMLVIAPERALPWREAGLLHLRLRNPRAAVAALEQFVARTDNPQARGRTMALLQELKGHLH